ncbi:MFS transporter [Flindersiella endophytica]
MTRWGLYAWANHGWAGAVSTVLIGPWILSLATTAAGSERAPLFSIGPWTLAADAFPSFAIALAALVQVIALPLLGAAADAHTAKRRLLAWLTIVASVLTMLLATTGGSAWLYAGILFVLGNFAFGATDVVYNSFLPHLVPQERLDHASGKGAAIGFLGSGLVMGVNLLQLQFSGLFGMDQATAVRWCFVVAGLWWLGFGLYAIAGLRDRHPGLVPAVGTAPGSAPAPGKRMLRRTLTLLRRMPHTRRYLAAYLLFADAISGVVGLASVYITHEIFASDTASAAPFLFTLILTIQFVAFGGTLIWPPIARRLTTYRTLLLTLVLWCGVVIYAFAALHSKLEAIILGVVIGIIIGGSQSLARSLYSQMIPRGRETMFFSLYEIADKGTSWIAPLVFTIVVNVTGSYRQAILSLIVMFVAGMLILTTANVDRARQEALAESEA